MLNLIGSISNSTTQQLYNTTQMTPVKNTQAAKPSIAASEEATESGAEKATEMTKGEEIDTYA